MKLVLSVTNPALLMANQAPEHAFTESGGSIGRNPLNDWVICDARRFISGKHAEISYNNGKFYLTDCSTNGVYLNNSSDAIGNGNTIPLNDGDQLTLGELSIDTQYADDTIQVTPPPAHNGSASDDIFADLLGDLGTPAQNQSVPDNFGNEPGMEELIGASSSPDANFDHDEVIDPLAILDGDTKDKKGIYDAIINSGMPEQPPSNIPDSALDFAFQTPSVQNEPSEGQIPDNWDILSDDMGTQAPLSNNDTLAEPTSSLNAELDVLDLIGGSDVQLQKPAQAQQTQKAAPSPSPAPAAPPMSHTVATNADASIDIILKTAGLNPQAYTHEQKQNILPLVGVMLRSCLDGLVTALMARNQVKSGLRMAVTTIAPVENNPLKFSINGEEALRNLLAAREGYLGPKEAISEGYQDLQIHQLAMMAATQKTLQALVARFDPNHLAQDFENTKSAGLKIGTKKMHYWDQYEIFYKKMEEAIGEDFQNTLGDVFADAYEEQTQKAKIRR